MKRIAAILLIGAMAPAAGATPNDAQALVQLARDAITHGEPARAVEYLEKAVALEPNNAEYHYRLGNAYGPFGGQLHAWTGDAEQVPRVPPEGRGAVDRARQREAKSSYAASLKINPNQKDADAAMKRVS